MNTKRAIALIIFLNASIFIGHHILITTNNGHSAEVRDEKNSRRQTNWEPNSPLWHNSIPLFCLLEHQHHCIRLCSSSSQLGQCWPWVSLHESVFLVDFHLLSMWLSFLGDFTYRQHIMFPVVSSPAFQQRSICSLWLICPWALILFSESWNSRELFRQMNWMSTVLCITILQHRASSGWTAVFISSLIAFKKTEFGLYSELPNWMLSKLVLASWTVE